MQERFWRALEELVASCQIVIDRPRASHHPRYPSLVYPFDYGYLDGTSASDGGGIDVWVGTRVDRKLDGVALTIDLHKRDVEMKLFLGCSPTDIDQAMAFMNRGSMQAAYLPRDDNGLRFLWERRSVRKFRPDPVPAAVVRELLAAANRAPSAHNRQPWRFVVIQSLQAKEILATGMGEVFRRDLEQDGVDGKHVEKRVARSRQRIVQAPVSILICLDSGVLDTYADKKREQAEQVMGVQSAAMAGQNLMLAAHAFGLGAVWICAPLFVPAEVRKLLDLPESWLPQGMVLLGYPQALPPMRSRQDVEQLTIYR